MRKRRKRKAYWFPNIGTAGPNEALVDDDDGGIWFALRPDLSGGSVTFLTDLTFDAPLEDEADVTQDRLIQVLGNGYILKRIVGKFLAGLDVNNGAVPLGLLITCGFFVARADDSTFAVAGDPIPIGAQTQVQARENYSPAAVSTVREPWIWRRRWILGNSAKSPPTVTTGSAVSQFPTTTAGYGSVLDGPHIDAKTGRRVDGDNRLWFAAAARFLGPDGDNPFNVPATEPVVALNTFCHLDYRLLGNLTRQRSRGVF